MLRFAQSQMGLKQIKLHMLTYLWIRFLFDDNNCPQTTNASENWAVFLQLLNFRQKCLTWRKLAFTEVRVWVASFLQTDETEPMVTVAASYVLKFVFKFNQNSAAWTSANARTFVMVVDTLCHTSILDYDYTLRFACVPDLTQELDREMQIGPVTVSVEQAYCRIPDDLEGTSFTHTVEPC